MMPRVRSARAWTEVWALVALAFFLGAFLILRKHDGRPYSDLSVGDHLAANVETLEGINLGRYNGHDWLMLTVIDPDCQACSNEVAVLNGIFNSWRGTMDVVAISEAGLVDLRHFVTENGAEYPHFTDSAGHILGRFSFREFPFHVLLEDGVVRSTSVEEMEYVQELLDMDRIVRERGMD